MRSLKSYVSAALLLSFVIALSGVGGVSAQTGPLKRAEGDVTWSVQPATTTEGTRSTFEYSTDPGTQVVDFVVVSNRGETPAEFSIYATDAINDSETGAFGLLTSDVPPTDLGKWITMDVNKIVLQPGEEATIPFNLLIPSDATPGDHVAGVIASIITTSEGAEGTTLNLEQRVAARMYLRVSGAVESGVEISGLTSAFTPELNPFAFGRVTVDYNVRNSGNVRIDANQKIQITGPFGIPLAEITPDPFSDLLPRQTVEVTADIPQIAALFLAFSNVTVVPGPLGTAGEVIEDAPSETPNPQSTDAAQPVESAEPTEAAPPAESEAPTESTEAAPIDASNLDDAVDFVPVTASSTTLAISWTLLALILVILLAIYLIVRYVSTTRQRMYDAIDEAAAAARQEALAGNEAATTR
jgi:hypothetical protein